MTKNQMKLSANAEEIFKDMENQYSRCITRVYEKKYFQAVLDAYLITGYEDAIFNAEMTGNINNKDTKYLLKLLREFVMDIYNKLKGIEVMKNA